MFFSDFFRIKIEVILRIRKKIKQWCTTIFTWPQKSRVYQLILLKLKRGYQLEVCVNGIR